jgi:hypothetical protein
MAYTISHRLLHWSVGNTPVVTGHWVGRNIDHEAEDEGQRIEFRAFCGGVAPATAAQPRTQSNILA